MIGPSPLLDLPRETRNQIYRELLTPTIGTEPRDSYGLNPAILRVNRQVHSEASEFLYDENCWILFTTNGPPFSGRNQYSSDYGTPTSVLLRGESSFGGQFAMRIDITARFDYPYNDTRGLCWIVASVYDLQRTLVGLMSHLSLRRFQLVVGIHDSFQKHPKHHERMLECLLGVRGVPSALVHGNQLQYPDKYIERQMMTQYQHSEEVTERLLTYQRRGDRQVALGKLLEAAIIYKDGTVDPRYHLEELRYTMVEPSDWTSLIDMLHTASALCSIGVGRIAEARSEISEVLDNTNLQDADRATALYVQGLIFLAEESYTDASIVFHEALALRPGYEALVQEVDRMKANFQMPKGTDDAS